MTAKRSRNYHDQHRWKKNLPKLIDWGKNLWLTLCEKMLLLFPCCELLSPISFRISCHPRKGTRKIEKGKKLSDTQTEEDPSNLRHKQSSRVQAVSPFRPSLSRESKKVEKKKERKKIKKQKRVSRNDRIRNSFRQRRQWNRNQSALWSCSFMSRLKFVLIYWTFLT